MAMSEQLVYGTLIRRYVVKPMLCGVGLRVPALRGVMPVTAYVLIPEEALPRRAKPGHRMVGQLSEANRGDTS